MRRREMVQALAALGLVPRLGLAARGRIERPGIQLYTVRDLVARDFEGTLAALREIGFREVEFAGYPPGLNGPRIAEIVAAAGLTAPSGHIGLDLIRGDWYRTIEFARDVGHRYLVVASLPEAERSRDGYRRVSQDLNRAAEAARQIGLQLCYHNHDFEFEPVGGRVPYDLLLREADPNLVQFELDVYWMTRAGRDPLTYFDRWPGRFPLLHLKDMDRTPSRGFTELGRGRIDFARILAASKRGGSRHFFYEQDRTAGDPLASARTSYAYLASLRF